MDLSSFAKIGVEAGKPDVNIISVLTRLDIGRPYLATDVVT